MSERSYHQFCPVSYSLDLIGDRWTLLIVREMLFGPRRYKDLQTGLPGIGTNLLADRLRSLEQHGIIRGRQTPPPFCVSVYELTDYGRELRPVIEALATWGMPLLPCPIPEKDFVGVIPTLSSIFKLFNPTAANGLHLSVLLEIEDEIYRLIIADGQLSLAPQQAAPPDLAISSTARALMQLVNGHLTPEQACRETGFTLERGDKSFLATFASLFSPH
jgi:DNA-binding HxlR family transcriptional regulator